jgi:hypothetical protein
MISPTSPLLPISREVKSSCSVNAFVTNADNSTISPGSDTNTWLRDTDRFSGSTTTVNCFSKKPSAANFSVFRVTFSTPLPWSTPRYWR